MIAFLSAWILVFWLSLSFGVGFLKFSSKWSAYFGDKEVTFERLAYLLIFGFLVITTSSSIISIFFPINLFVKALYIGVGCILSILFFRTLWKFLERLLLRGRTVSGGIKLIFMLILSASVMSCVSEIIHVDTGLYHLQAIQWVKGHPVVPGLGNLYGRLAFNSHFFIASALFSFFFSEVLFILPLNSFFFILFVVSVLSRINRSLRQKQIFDLAFYSTLLLFYFHHLLLNLNTSSTDHITSILVFYAFILFKDFLSQKSGEFELVLLWLLISTIFTFKLSAALSLVFLLITLFYLPVSKWLPLLLTGLVVVTPFIARNIFLSGYPLFPFHKLDIVDVEWKIPFNKVLIEKEFIESYAKLGYIENKPFDRQEAIDLQADALHWINPWFKRLGIKWKAIFMMNVFLCIPGFLAIYKRDFTTMLICICIWINLIFWFFNAPDPRFAYGFLFLGCALVLSYILSPFLIFLLRVNERFFTGSLLIVLSISILIRLDIFSYKKWDATQFFLPVNYTVSSTKDFSGRNFTCKTPSLGESCLNAPIPCTPYPHSALIQRGAQIRDGFMIAEE
jgi:hypothetical protein